MGFTAFEIKLDNSFQSYFAGQFVSGKIIIGLNRQKKVKGIKLKLIGKAKTHWKENRGKSSTTVSETEYYIDEKVYLFGYEETNAEVFLPQGWNEYPFWFQLPAAIPSSFEMKHGYVKYYLEVIISRDSFKFDHKMTKLFTVNALVDLNAPSVINTGGITAVVDRPSGGSSTTGGGTTDDTGGTSQQIRSSVPGYWNARHEIELYNEKTICCFCCTSGPISFHLKIPKTGYVPGEGIPFFMELNNMSQRNISLVTLSLAQYSTFYAKKKSKQVSNEVVAVNGPTVTRGQTDVVWQESNLLIIPPVPPTNLGGGCNIIEVKYFVKVEIDIPGGLSLKGKVPVIIGTIPLRGVDEPAPPQLLTADEQIVTDVATMTISPTITNTDSNYRSPNRPTSSVRLYLAVHSESENSANQQPLAGYPNLPPPSYEEAILCYSAQQRRDDGLEEDMEQGDEEEDEEDKHPPDYKKATRNGPPTAEGEGSDDEEKGGGTGGSGGDGSAGNSGQQQSHGSQSRASRDFVPKYVTYKHLSGTGGGAKGASQVPGPK